MYVNKGTPSVPNWVEIYDEESTTINADTLDTKQYTDIQAEIIKMALVLGG